MPNTALIPESEEAIRAYIEAEDVAARHHQTVSSAHVLLALFNFPNRAQVLLRERHIDADWVLQELSSPRHDARRGFARLKERARVVGDS